ncbi:serine/threonine-protein kinase LMTK1 isoform X2 [Lepisosteus oculatus]|uniref:serine/threonine-protein kinase LMTK1 isoform X2 n=1 Tax=Lepisosteus oculatus TaxID=7918 RepID=UPI0037149B30
MCARLFVLVMSSSFFNPSFAFSSHFDPDGAPLSELSWSSSLAVVAVSFSGLFTFIFLMLACLCCKKGDIGFKEFENTEGEEYQADFSTLASPASQNGPEVYILPLTEVSLPVSKQPGRSVQLLKSTDLGRHSLLYLKEIGHGWFGKVLLGEVNSGLSTTQVVVKELKASASVQDQMQFLEEAQPYRALQHPALLQCLAQCTEVTPYLLVMEFCPLGDLKGYLRSCRAADSMTPDPLTLQRMACEIASGLLHLHKHNYVHSDLALRNCLLTAEVTVKIGDYGLSHNKYKDDYFVTSDQIWVPLRWIAPELIDEVHGNLLVVDQTKPSNIWSLGVTIWELFELGNQPYHHYSDRQVLTYAIKEQQLKLPKPLLKVPLSDRWYEVMQFCWLQPDQRPTAEEVHLLLSYLCAKGASEAEEDFEKRWNSLRPNGGNSGSHSASASVAEMPSSSSSSFPLLEHFSAGDGFHSEPGDDILTVTETSRGLNFEYKWEQALPEQHFLSSSTSGPLGHGNPQYQDIYYPPGSGMNSCGGGGLTLGVSPSYYDSKQLHTPGVVPVLSAHSPSLNSEYYIRIEEPSECNIDLEYTMCSYSPEFDGNFVEGSSNSRNCLNCSSEAETNSYWAGDAHKASAYDSDTSPVISLTMEPLLGQVTSANAVEPWVTGHGQYFSYKVRDREQSYYYENSPSDGADQYLAEDPSEMHQESWGSRSLRQALGELENPLGISPSLSSPQPVYCDPYLEGSHETIHSKSAAGECYYDMMGSLRKTMPGSNTGFSIDMEREDSQLFVQHQDSDLDEEDLFIERQSNNWTSNISANNNSLNFVRRPGVNTHDAYVDFHFTVPSEDLEDSWREIESKENLAFSGPKLFTYLETMDKESDCISLNNQHKLYPSNECNTYVYLCHESGNRISPHRRHNSIEKDEFVDPLSGSVIRRSYALNNIKEKKNELNGKEKTETTHSLPEGGAVTKTELSETQLNQDLGKKNSLSDQTEHPIDLALKNGRKLSEKESQKEGGNTDIKNTSAACNTPFQYENPALPGDTANAQSESVSENSHTVDSGVEKGYSSISLVEIDDCSDDDITDVTSGIFSDFPMDYANIEDSAPTFKSLQKQVGTPDSIDSLDLPSTTSSCDAFSPATFRPSSQPKAVDSGYDTENNESPEFVLKEPHEPRDPDGFGQPLAKPTLTGSPGPREVEAVIEIVTQTGVDEEANTLSTSHGTELELTGLNKKNPYRDSAYFSDYDAEIEKFPRDEGDDFTGQGAKKEDLASSTEREELSPLVNDEEQQQDLDKHPVGKELLPENHIGCEVGEQKIDRPVEINKAEISPRGEVSDQEESGPVLSSLAPSPPELGACLTKEGSQDEGLGLESDHSGEDQSSECSSSSVSEGPTQQEPPASSDPGKGIASIEDSPAESLSHETSRVEGDGNEMKEEEETIPVVESSPSCPPEKEKTPEELLHDDHETQENEVQEMPEASKALENPALSSPPQDLQAIEGRVSPVDGEEADEEDGDSEDSEESDEELRCYNIQEQSEESEEEFPSVPIVVSNSSEARNLRSLLKMPSLLSQSFCEEMDRKKKAVSFFDDVTVYLFDQESPTRELGEHSFPPGEESRGRNSDTGETHSQERVSDDSSDGNVSEESGGFEWDDDFPLMPVSTSLAPSKEPPVTSSLPTRVPEPKLTGSAVQYSRFTVSPSSVSRFSITHVSDSDIDSAGGSSEDGERD